MLFWHRHYQVCCQGRLGAIEARTRNPKKENTALRMKTVALLRGTIHPLITNADCLPSRVEALRNGCNEAGFMRERARAQEALLPAQNTKLAQ